MTGELRRVRLAHAWSPPRFTRYLRISRYPGAASDAHGGSHPVHMRAGIHKRMTPGPQECAMIEQGGSLGRPGIRWTGMRMYTQGEDGFGLCVIDYRGRRFIGSHLVDALTTRGDDVSSSTTSAVAVARTWMSCSRDEMNQRGPTAPPLLARITHGLGRWSLSRDRSPTRRSSRSAWRQSMPACISRRPSAFSWSSRSPWSRC